MGKTAAILLDLIKKENISYGELSIKTGIPKSAIQRYAIGETEKIPLTRIELLAKALGVTPQYLAGWDDLPRPGA
jgi:repressor LexA